MLPMWLAKSLARVLQRWLDGPAPRTKPPAPRFRAKFRDQLTGELREYTLRERKQTIGKGEP